MKKRPILLVLLSLVHVMVAVGFLAQVSASYGFSYFDLSSTWSYLTVLNKVIVFNCLLIAVLSFQASNLLWPALAANCLLVFWNNYLVASWGVNATLTASLLASAFYLGACTTTLTSSIRLIMLRPEMRWWLNRRIRMKRKVLLSLENKKIETETFDVSRSGAFLQYATPYNIEVDQNRTFNMTIGPNSKRPLTLSARFIRRTEDKNGAYPAGLGVRFENLGLKEKLHLKALRFDIFN